MELDAMKHTGHFDAHYNHVYPCVNLCYWCGRKCACGKEIGFKPTLIKPSNRMPKDISDNVGWICKQCHVRGCPPHKLFVDKLLGPFLNGDTDLTHLITKLAYPVCKEPRRGHCFKCNPLMQPGHRCRVCKRMATGMLPSWEYMEYMPTRRRFVAPIPIDPSLNYHRVGQLEWWNAGEHWSRFGGGPYHQGRTNDGGWQWQLGRWNAGGSWARFGGGGWAPGGRGWASGGGGRANGWDWRD